MASGYEITVVRQGSSKPLLEYTGPVEDVHALAVDRSTEGTVRLVYGHGGAPLVLAEGKDPGGTLELVRLRQAKDAKPVTQAVD